MAELSLAVGQNASMKQTQRLAPQMRQSLALLEMNALQLRHELRALANANPAFEFLDGGEEAPLSGDAPADDPFDGRPEDDDPDARRADQSDLPPSEREMDFTPDGAPAEEMLADNAGLRDYFIGDVENGAPYTPDDEKNRDFLFNARRAQETLQEHLLGQLEFSGLSPDDRALASTLIGDIDGDGRFAGSIPDVSQVTGRSEKDIRAVLRAITALDPQGCGATTLRECLLAQMEKLDDSPWEDEVRRLVDRHLEDLAAKRTDAVCAALGISPRDLPKVVAELRRLDPRPGRAIPGPDGEPVYVKPEVFFTKRDGRYVASVDARRVPVLRLSRAFRELLERGAATAADKAWIRQKLAEANDVLEALERRPETIRRIGQEICDAQADYLDGGKLKPLTIRAVAGRVGINESTVSRTVKGKYVSTPRGTVEMRQFFTAGGIETDAGTVSNAEVKDRIRAIVSAEDVTRPLSDQKIAEMLKGEGMSVARRTVAVYREALGIPGSSARRFHA